VNENNKIIIFLVSIPVIAIIIIFIILRVNFAPSFSPTEQKVFTFTDEHIPKLTERRSLSVSSLKSPINLTQSRESEFPTTSLAEIVPPPAIAGKRVSFILVNQKRKFAIIDGKLVHEGDKMDNHSIARIEKDKILLKNREGEKWLKLD
jgi:hypothetical protein